MNTSSPHDQQSLQEGVKLRVLLAEDQEINRKVTSILLSRRGHVLETARDGSEALEKWKNSHFDIILMDVEMPVMDGVQATGLIRASERNEERHTPIIALTAHALNDDKERLLSQGFDGYVSKPMDVQMLLQEIQRCLRGSGGD